MEEIFMAAITVLAVGTLFLYRDSLRHVASFVSRNPLVRDAAYGFSEVRLPEGWRSAKNLNDGAGIEVLDPLRGRYALVFSESRDDFDANLSLDQYSADTRDTLTASILLLGVSGPERRRVGGYDALQYEIEGVHQMTEIKYLHTVLVGNRAFHQVLAWAPRSRYSRAAFEKLLDGFAETPGQTASPRAHVQRSSVPRRIGF
jgi:hypothetical protein